MKHASLRTARAIGRPAGLAWIGVTLAACLAAPDREEHPVEHDLAAEYTSAGEAGVYPFSAEVPWWASFGEPELNALIIEALERNRDLRAAAQRVRALAADLAVASSLRLPAIDGAASISRQEQIFQSIDFGSGPLHARTTTFQAGLDFNWELDFWGRLAEGENAAARDFEASAADRHAARLSIAGKVAIAWFALRETRLQVELAERTVASLQSNARWIDERYKAGLRNALDLRLARNNVAVAEANLRARGQALSEARRRIELLLGRYPMGELQESGAFTQLPAAVPAGLPAALLARRPDLHATQMRLAALDHRAEQAMLELYPKLSLTGNFGRIGSEITDLLDGDLTQWGLLTNLAVPIFDSGRRHATLAAHEARLQEATELFASSVLVACAEVESALENEGWLREQVAHLETAAQEARVALTLAREQYTSGLVGVLFVLESERLAFNADSALIAVRRMLFQNRVNLHLALGGGFGSAADEEQATADSETVMDEASESATEERG